MYNFSLAKGQSLERRLEEIASYLRVGKKINEIKLDRECTIMGLNDAKAMADRIELMMCASRF